MRPTRKTFQPLVSMEVQVYGFTPEAWWTINVQMAFSCCGVLNTIFALSYKIAPLSLVTESCFSFSSTMSEKDDF